MITQEDIIRWRQMTYEATPIAHIEGSDTMESGIFRAIYRDEDELEFSCADFDREADALLFAHAASIITRLLDELEKPLFDVWTEPDDPEDYEHDQAL